MSKLTRQTQKLFCGTAATSDIGEFGSLAASAPVTTTDIQVIQSLPAWLAGWAEATIGTLIPAYQDMNAVQYVGFYQICYLLQMGIAEYDANTTYYANSICQISGQVYISLVDNNLDNAPSTSPTQWQAGLPGAEITGVVKSFAGVVAPYGYLLCDGSAYSRTSYAALFAICGTNYGAGNGSTTFNVPDLRTRVPVGYKSGDSNFGTVGQVGGEEEHTLVVTEIPSHTHTVNGDTNAPHTPYAGFGHQAQSSSPVDSTGSTGGDGAHNNLQPYVTMNYIIKT